jgi:hypothetical protein
LELILDPGSGFKLDSLAKSAKLQLHFEIQMSGQPNIKLSPLELDLGLPIRDAELRLIVANYLSQHWQPNYPVSTRVTIETFARLDSWPITKCQTPINIEVTPAIEVPN